MLFGSIDTQLITQHPFTSCMWFTSDIVVNTARKLASKWFIPASICNCVDTSCTSGALASEFILQGNGATIGSAFQHFGGHTSHWGKRQSDEHIILRTSLLTMPIYFDNQLTIVPVQPLKGQWYIRIDQFWVTSCAALWGQTEAWLAVQSGMLSNAQGWLTAHQHAELNSLAKCFPFTLTTDIHIKLWISRSCYLHQNKPPHIHLQIICIHIIRHFKKKKSKSKHFLHKTLNMFDDKPQENRNKCSSRQLKLWVTLHYIKHYMPSYK